jgi:hypothetical protein
MMSVVYTAGVYAYMYNFASFKLFAVDLSSSTAAACTYWIVHTAAVVMHSLSLLPSLCDKQRNTVCHACLASFLVLSG